MFCIYIQILCVASLLTFANCCHSFGNILAEVKLKNGVSVNKSTHGCIDKKISKANEIVTHVLVKNQPVQHLTIGAVEDMPELVYVEFTKCKIERVKARAFRTVPKLRTIAVTYGVIEEINSGVFVNLPSVTKISLAHNNISKIEIGSFALPSLQVLNMWSNKLTVWNEEWFDTDSPAAVEDITEIDFRDNLFTELLSNSFSSLGGNLTKVVFDSNMISNVEPHAFRGLTKLKHLGLAYNRITKIDVRWFPQPMHLTKLAINANKLNYISSDVLKRISPQEVSLDGNPWECACWKKILMWAHNNSRMIVTSANCQEENDVPVCVSVKDSTTCAEIVDEDVTRTFFAAVKKSVKDLEAVKKKKCYRLD